MNSAKTPRMRDYLFHLEHVQAGRWAEPRCSVCNLHCVPYGAKRQSEVAPGTEQRLSTSEYKKRHR